MSSYQGNPWRAHSTQQSVPEAKTVDRRVGRSCYVTRTCKLPLSRKHSTLLARVRVWDNPTVMILTLDAKRRLTVPASLAPARPGDHFLAEFDPEEDTLVFRRIAKRADWLAVLKSCPVRMEELPPRSRELPRLRKL